MIARRTAVTKQVPVRNSELDVMLRFAERSHNGDVPRLVASLKEARMALFYLLTDMSLCPTNETLSEILKWKSVRDARAAMEMR